MERISFKDHAWGRVGTRGNGKKGMRVGRKKVWKRSDGHHSSVAEGRNCSAEKRISCRMPHRILCSESLTPAHSFRQGGNRFPIETFSPHCSGGRHPVPQKPESGRKCREYCLARGTLPAYPFRTFQFIKVCALCLSSAAHSSVLPLPPARPQPLTCSPEAVSPRIGRISA